jgi:hypothetical protein
MIYRKSILPVGQNDTKAYCFVSINSSANCTIQYKNKL